MKQDPKEIAQFERALHEAARKGRKGTGFTCKKTDFEIRNHTVSSWKFQDWDYKRKNLPTYARGLFTTKNSKGDIEIVTRGYDKFFNVDEISTTRWQHIEDNTIGPYELSVKENGCIIFISGLEDGTPLVCSKHSTGARADTPLSHAQAGERWVEKHVASVGKTVEEFSRELREMNVTAVGELCDDSFEEHVLAYDENAAGIYLHGINYNVPDFATFSSSKVHEFADKWGFKKAMYTMKDNIHDIRAFLEECARTGSWNNRDTEGFVVRCQMRVGRGPYNDWFFKFKFEEPYLMYRQWREVTKAILAGKEPKYRKHVNITTEYLGYAKKQFAENPKLKAQYKENHGIIALRDGFLRERGLKGSEIIAMEKENGDGATMSVTNDIVLVTVASIGCGKTTVAVSLTKLFGWGHFQNDNIQGTKNRPKRFAQGVVRALSKYPVVISDRNNHQKRERKQIIEDVQQFVPKATFVALHYVHEPKRELADKIRSVTQSRVFERGDNHQTIHMAKGKEEVQGIMDGFLQRFQGIDRESEPDSKFDEVINLDPCASSRENLETVVSSLREMFPALMENRLPSAADLDRAIDEATADYTVDLKHDLNFDKSKDKDKGRNKQQPKQQQPDSPQKLVKRLEYFNITVPTPAIISHLVSLFPPDSSPDRAQLYNHLKESGRLQSSFHVTLIHRASAPSKPDVWEHYVNLYTAALQSDVNRGSGNVTPTLSAARVRLERLVWDARLMAFVVRILPAEQVDRSRQLKQFNEDEVTEGVAGMEGLGKSSGAAAPAWPCANDVAHITVGTTQPEVKPKESNDLLRHWLEVGAGGDTGIWEAEVPGIHMLDGIVGEVLRR